MGAKGTHCNPHRKLDQFSVFAGRNPLKVATAGETALDIEGCILNKSLATKKTTGSDVVPQNCSESEDETHQNSTICKQSEPPDIHQLQMLEGRDRRKLRIMHEVAPHWKNMHGYCPWF